MFTTGIIGGFTIRLCGEAQTQNTNNTMHELYADIYHFLRILFMDGALKEKKRVCFGMWLGIIIKMYVIHNEYMFIIKKMYRKDTLKGNVI